MKKFHTDPGTNYILCGSVVFSRRRPGARLTNWADRRLKRRWPLLSARGKTNAVSVYRYARAALGGESASAVVPLGYESVHVISSLHDPNLLTLLVFILFQDLHRHDAMSSGTKHAEKAVDAAEEKWLAAENKARELEKMVCTHTCAVVHWYYITKISNKTDLTCFFQHSSSLNLLRISST